MCPCGYREGACRHHRENAEPNRDADQRGERQRGEALLDPRLETGVARLNLAG